MSTITTANEELVNFMRVHNLGQGGVNKGGAPCFRIQISGLPLGIQADHMIAAGKIFDDAMKRIHNVSDMQAVPEADKGWWKSDGMLDVTPFYPVPAIRKMNEEESRAMLGALQEWKKQTKNAEAARKSLNDLAKSEFRFHTSYIVTEGDKKQLVFALSVPPGEYDSLRSNMGAEQLNNLPILESANAAVGEEDLFKKGKLQGKYDGIYVTEDDAQKLKIMLTHMPLKRGAFEAAMQCPPVAAKQYQDGLAAQR